MTVTSTQFDQLLDRVERLVEAADRIAAALEVSNEMVQTAFVTVPDVEEWAGSAMVTGHSAVAGPSAGPARGGTRRLGS